MRAVMLLSLFVTVVANAGDYPRFEDLTKGRAIWLETCEGCHAYGVGGAPVPTKPAQWAERLRKPVAELYDHALNGFMGENFTDMPARGGNPTLSDDQVKAAVDYMRRFATINQP